MLYVILVSLPNLNLSSLGSSELVKVETQCFLQQVSVQVLEHVRTVVHMNSIWREGDDNNLRVLFVITM